MIDGLKTQLEEVRQQMRSKNRNNPQEAAEYVDLKRQEDALIEQITAAQKEQTIVKKDAEIQELVLGYNFNELFGDPEANKLIHSLMMEQVGKYEGIIAGLYSEVEQKDQTIIALSGDVSEKSAEIDRLQGELQGANSKLAELEGAEDRVSGLKKIIEENGKEIADLKTRVEEEMRESRFFRNEAARHELELRRLRTENDEMKRARTLERDTKPNEVAQRIMERTQQKRKLANVRTNPDGSITGTDAEGSEVTVPWFAKNSVEAVDTFPAKSDESVEESAASNPALVEPIPAPTFSVTPQNDASGVESVQPAGDGEANAGEGAANDADSAKSLEERVAALEYRVFQIEQKNGMITNPGAA